ncbi:MAG: hypothetical protein ACPGGA_04805 [Balneolaceae bacterium]
MLRILAIITFALFLINCQSTPVSDLTQKDQQELQAKDNNQPTTCLTNNESEECSLLLEEINFSLPDLHCDPYEFVVDIETSFFTPAGLGDGSTSRIDWEFLPNGNAGFWVTDLEKPIPPNSRGSITMTGCFSYGDQSTLRIKRTITDQIGNISNELVIDIEDPRPSKVIAGPKSEFEFFTTDFTLTN